MMKNMSRILLLAVLAFLAIQCKKNKDDSDNEPGIVEEYLFPVSKDIELGEQLDSTIQADPTTYPILDESQYPEAYTFLRAMRDSILQSGHVTYADDFEWKLTIIQDDSTLNAFAAPGGFIYVYTGLMKYLSSEYALAGVMGHEIAHADLRHSSEQMRKQYGVSILLSVLLGEDPGKLTQIAANLLFLSFSRDDEEEADEYSVIYLCETDYKADGASVFFEQLEAEGGSSVPAFLSTHPSSESRVEDIQAKAVELNCEGAYTDGAYAAMIATLP